MWTESDSESEPVLGDLKLEVSRRAAGRQNTTS
jgi:hypothetical protein